MVSTQATAGNGLRGGGCTGCASGEFELIGVEGGGKALKHGGPDLGCAALVGIGRVGEAREDGGLQLRHIDLVQFIGCGAIEGRARPLVEVIGNVAEQGDGDGLPPAAIQLGGTDQAALIVFSDEAQAAIADALDKVDATPLAEVLVGQVKDVVEEAETQPEAKTAVAGLPGWVAFGEVVSGRGGGELEEDAVEDTALVDGRAATRAEEGVGRGPR